MKSDGKIYEAIFSSNSYGFRPKRSAKKAIRKSKKYINNGYKWVVYMDLGRFFDKVNHDILMVKLAEKITVVAETGYFNMSEIINTVNEHTEI